jgi:hypothetical protein
VKSPDALLWRLLERHLSKFSQAFLWNFVALEHQELSLPTVTKGVKILAFLFICLLIFNSNGAFSLFDPSDVLFHTSS